MRDFHADALLHACARHARSTLSQCVQQLIDQLLEAQFDIKGLMERQAVVDARVLLEKHSLSFCHHYEHTLLQAFRKEFKASDEPKKPSDWSSLSLVTDEVDEARLWVKRLATLAEHACDAELRELDGYMATLQSLQTIAPHLNPFRPEVLARALMDSLQELSNQANIRSSIIQNFGEHFVKLCQSVESFALDMLRESGVDPLRVRVVKPSHQTAPMPVAQPSTQDWKQHAHFAEALPPLSEETLAVMANELGALFGLPSQTNPAVSDNGLFKERTDWMSTLPPQRNSAWMREEAKHAPTTVSLHAAEALISTMLSLEMDLTIRTLSQQTPPPRDDSLNLTAPAEATENVLRHYEQPLKAAAQLPAQEVVIDAVTTFFDQIFADTGIHTEIIGLLGQLQWPVLHTALDTPEFFSSRHHSAREFMNRLTALSAGFESLAYGAGKYFLEQAEACVLRLSQDGVEDSGLFDEAIEIIEQAARAPLNAQEETQQAEVMAVLQRKELQMRAQLSYMATVRQTLANLDMPDLVRSFVVEIWSQAVVLASLQDGASSLRAQEFLQCACDLIMSVQPRNTPHERQKFLIKLPTMLKILREGLKAIGWPLEAQSHFFKQLSSAQSMSLQKHALSEHHQHLLVTTLAAFQSIPLPHSTSSAIPAKDDMTMPVDLSVMSYFDPQEAITVHLMPDDVALAPTLSPPIPDTADPEVPPPEPLTGRALFEVLRPGQAYLMQLNEGWKKVRLVYTSAGRAFYVFRFGEPQEMMTLTAKMLARLCDLRRVRSLNRSELLERAAMRARHQKRQFMATR